MPFSCGSLAHLYTAGCPQWMEHLFLHAVCPNSCPEKSGTAIAYINPRHLQIGLGKTSVGLAVSEAIGPQGPTQYKCCFICLCSFCCHSQGHPSSFVLASYRFLLTPYLHCFQGSLLEVHFKADRLPQPPYACLPSFLQAFTNSRKVRTLEGGSSTGLLA